MNKNQMNEEQKLKAENIKLKIINNQLNARVLDAQIRTTALSLAGQQEAFVASLVKEFGPGNFNWDKIEFIPYDKPDVENPVDHVVNSVDSVDSVSSVDSVREIKSTDNIRKLKRADEAKK